MQASSPTDRLACAILNGEKAIQRAVTLLAEAGFAAESISVVWCPEHEPSDEPDAEDAPAPLPGPGAAGATEDADGQFECIRNCALDDTSGDDIARVLGNCEGECLGQCADKDDGFALTDTQGLLGCGQDECLAECFTP